MAKKIFSETPIQRPKRNFIDLTHDVKMTTKFGQLAPVLTMECLPGDKITIGADTLIKFAPMIAPVMHRLNVYIHYFFVPNRIVWPNWEKFITQPPESAEIAPPYITMEYGGKYSSLMDYMGLPNLSLNSGFQNKDEIISAIPFAAYQKIYNDYYRDQDLSKYIQVGDVVGEINLRDGNNASNFDELVDIRFRSYEKDYFTSARPFAQKGASIAIPLTMNDVSVFRNDTAGLNFDGTLVPGGSPETQFIDGVPSENLEIPTTDLYANTSAATFGQSSISDLRTAVRLQEFVELSARAGTRYTEVNMAHFGVRSSDARLQRPEYIVGVQTPVIIGETLNTTGTEDVPQGNMSGNAYAAVQGRFASHFCEEHGYIIGIMSVMPKPAYQQGIPKHFSRLTSPMDYPWPKFANIGEQPIDIREIYAGQTEENQLPFGYTPRYAELHDLPNRVAGDFKTTLNFWTLSRIFGSKPPLNQEFVEVDPNSLSNTRIFAVQDGTDYLFCQVLNKIKSVRPLPKFGIPKF